MSPNTEFNLDLVSKARYAIRHFNQTDPNCSKTPAVFSDVLKAVLVSDIFSDDELNAMCITEEVKSKAFLGVATDLHRDERKSFMTSAKERTNEILGIPSEATFAVAQRRLQAA